MVFEISVRQLVPLGEHTMRHRRFVWGSLAVLVTIAITAVATPPAVAQIRAALVRDMDSPIRGTRHLINETPNFETGSFSVTETITPTIPAGKKLFVQNVSIHSFLTDGQSVMEARVSINNEAVAYVPQDFQAQSSGANPQRHFNGTVDVNQVVNAGESLNVFIFRNGNDGSSGLNFARIVVNGYLVDVNP
jgi:hypothetical protein